MMGTGLEIDSVWEYYDAPICGEGRLGDLRLYYFWVDDARIQHGGKAFKVRRYTAYELDEASWDLLERSRALDDAADPEVPPSQDELNRWEAICALHERLRSTDGVISFTSMSVRFPCYV